MTVRLPDTNGDISRSVDSIFVKAWPAAALVCVEPSGNTNPPVVLCTVPATESLLCGLATPMPTRWLEGCTISVLFSTFRHGAATLPQLIIAPPATLSCAVGPLVEMLPLTV